MHFSALPLSVALSLLPFLSARAQTNNDSSTATFFQDYLTFLNDSGYTGLSSALFQVNKTEAGQQWLSKLSDGNWTVFAPTNEAFSSIPEVVSGNSSQLLEYLSYHYVYGNLHNTTSGDSSDGGAGGESSSICTSSTQASEGGGQPDTSTISATVTASFTGTAIPTPSAYRLTNQFWQSHHLAASGPQLFSGVYPNVTIGRTLLNASDLVQLEGNKSQVLAWTRSGEDGNVTILNQILKPNPSSSQNITVSNAVQWRNLFIAEVNGVLIPPGNVETALTAVNDTALITFANQIQVPLNDGSNGSAVQALQEARGFTLFAPSADAFTSEVNSTIQQLQNNQTAVLSVLQNHYVNGSTIYSPTLMELAANASSGSSEQTIYTAAGEPLTVTYNDTGLFVNNGNGTSAQVTRPDVLVANGVIHIINNVLFNTASEPSAASSAFASASSVATETATDTGALGVFPVPTPTSGGGSSSAEVSQSTSSAEPSSTQSPSPSESTVSASEGGDGASSTPTPSSFRLRAVLHL